MKCGIPFLLLILSTLLCRGCVTFKEEEFATIRACHVSPAVYRKLKERECVTPADCVGKLPVCKFITTLGKICIRDGG